MFYFFFPKAGIGTGQGRVWDYGAVAAECRREDVYNEQVEQKGLM